MNHPAPIATAPATYQDVLDAPDGVVAELINGASHPQPRPAIKHARACFRLAGRLDDPFENGLTRHLKLTRPVASYPVVTERDGRGAVPIVDSRGRRGVFRAAGALRHPPGPAQ